MMSLFYKRFVQDGVVILTKKCNGDEFCFPFELLPASF